MLNLPADIKLNYLLIKIKLLFLRAMKYFWYQEGVEVRWIYFGWGYYNTSFIFGLKIPVFVWIKSQWCLQSNLLITGNHVCYIGLRFRVRSNEQYLKSGNRCIFQCQYYWKPVEDGCSVIAREDLEDVGDVTHC